MFLHFAQMWGYIFPPTEHETLLLKAQEKDLLSYYNPQQHTTCLSLLPYEEPLVQAAITMSKFYHHKKAITLLTQVLRHHFSHQQKPIHLLPVPLHQKRQRDRGYNQVTEILIPATEQYSHLHVQTHILQRIKNTPPQTSLSKKKRLLNMQHAFAVQNLTALTEPAAPLLIVDDVYTTGTTLQAAISTLQKHTSKPVTGLALAH